MHRLCLHKGLDEMTSFVNDAVHVQFLCGLLGLNLQVDVFTVVLPGLPHAGCSAGCSQPNFYGLVSHMPRHSSHDRYHRT